MQTTSTIKPYKKPAASVLVYGDITDSIVEKLKNILKLHGHRGLKIILASQSFPRALESLRKFLHENYTFTIEIYSYSSSLIEKLKTTRGDSEIVAVLVSSSELVNQVPSFLLDKLMVS